MRFERVLNVVRLGLALLLVGCGDDGSTGSGLFRVDMPDGSIQLEGSPGGALRQAGIEIPPIPPSPTIYDVCVQTQYMQCLVRTFDYKQCYPAQAECSDAVDVTACDEGRFRCRNVDGDSSDDVVSSLQRVALEATWDWLDRGCPGKDTRHREMSEDACL